MTGTVIEAVEAYSKGASFHPVKQFLDTLAPHDGAERVAELFSMGFGAPDNAYTRAVSASLMVSAIARIDKPGCFVKTMPVLEGAQDSGKSSALAILGGRWYLDNARRLDSKEFDQDIQGYWFIEIAELSGIMKSSAESVKATISRRDDVFRAAYGRRTQSHPRQCVLIGTTNSVTWQLDDTGGARFLPIACGTIDLKWLADNREQLFAEALALYRAGYKWHEIPLTDARAEQEARYVPDAWESRVAAWLIGRTYCTVDEILEQCIGKDLADREDRDVKRISQKILPRLGWRVKVEWLDGRSQRVYRPRP